MSQGILQVAYLAAAILFMLSLGGLSQQTTARRGNTLGIVGMAVALIATTLHPAATSDLLAFGAIAMGGGIGLRLAQQVAMTQMPELVALMHSLVGLAACLVGFASYIDTSTVFPTAAEKSIH